MSVRKRELASGKTAWVVDYRDGAGKRRAKQFATKGAAVSYETKTRSELAGGVHIPDSTSTTIAQAAALWLQRCRLDGLERGTLKNYEQHVRSHILPLIGAGTKLSKLTRPVIESFRDRLLETRSRVLANTVVTTFKSLLSDAQRRGLVVQNAALGTRVKAAGRHEKKRSIPTKDEIRILIAKTAELWPVTSPWRPLVITALFSGLRASELRGLTWDHVDFEKKIIRVQQRADFKNKMGSPKSKAGTRTVPLSPLVLNTLRQWRLACPRTELGLVFPTRRGRIVAQSTIFLIWRQLLKACELSGYRFHDLRHAAASLFIEQGMQAKKVQAIMGHSSIQMTFDLYGHLWETAEDDQAAVAAIEKSIFG